MSKNVSRVVGRHFLQIPGPTPLPDRILRAMDRPALDFMGAEFRAIAEECYAGLRQVFKTDGAIIAYASNGHGAWEAAIVNVFSPGDKVLVPETGYFSLNWAKHAQELGLEVETLPGDWRAGVDPAAVETRLREDKAHTIKAVMQVHNETVTGVANRIPEIRKELAKLNPADRKLVLAQRFCPISEGSPLGSMGAPVKVMIDGQPALHSGCTAMCMWGGVITISAPGNKGTVSVS